MSATLIDNARARRKAALDSLKTRDPHLFSTHDIFLKRGDKRRDQIGLFVTARSERAFSGAAA